MKWVKEKWEKKDNESVVFLLFLFCMAVYYGWRLFALTPWYDELYTYCHFISRGPVYAAIHWPLPNNHVGYSVLSAFLDLFGNAVVGLRGVSWICSLFSLCLLYQIGRDCLPKGCALIPVFLFASMQLVNNLAVQGRGYALASCLYLTAFYELTGIVSGQRIRRRNYILFGGALVWALYTLPSSVYFVVPLCVIGGTWLLFQKRNREFVKLFLTAVVSAVVTTGLYLLIWLAIGSNLLSKTMDSGFYGKGHISIILHAPFQAARTGIDYMLDTPYIQSIPRKYYLLRLAIWIKNLFESYYPGLSLILAIGIIAGIIVVAGKVLRGKKWRERTGQSFLEWYLLLSFLLTPLMLIIQAALPYYRVFSFFGIPVVLLLTWLFIQIVMRIGGWIKRVNHSGNAAVSGTVPDWASLFIAVISVVLEIICLVTVFSPANRGQYSSREAAIEDAFRYMASIETGDAMKEKVICVTDCDQEYLLKFLFDREDWSRVIEESDYILLDKMLFLSEEEMLALDEAGADTWKFYVTHDGIPWEFLENNREICYENDRFVLYKCEDDSLCEPSSHERMP